MTPPGQHGKPQPLGQGEVTVQTRVCHTEGPEASQVPTIGQSTGGRACAPALQAAPEALNEAELSWRTQAGLNNSSPSSAHLGFGFQLLGD